MYLISSFCLPFINVSSLFNSCLVILAVHLFLVLGFPLSEQTCLITPSCFAYKLLSSYFQFCNSISVDFLSLKTGSGSKRRIIKSRFRSANHNLESSKRTRIQRDYLILIRYDMAQPANMRAPLGIDAFWDKKNTRPPSLLGEMESAVQTGTIGTGEYISRHSTWT